MTDTPINPLLNRINRMPGETIRLPSLGKFYTNGELEDSVNGEITLYPMTMTDEIMMKTADMLFQGTAIERVLRRCSPNIKKPMELLTSDVDFILVNLRRISYGPTIEVPFVCESNSCKHENHVTVQLDYFTSTSKEIKVDTFEEDYTLINKSDGFLVRLKPIRFNEWLRLQQVIPKMVSPELNEIDLESMEEYVLESIAVVIASVGDVENNNEQNHKFIKEWINSIPRSDSEAIMQQAIKVQDWGPTFRYKVKCAKCKHSQELTTELNPTAFFTQPSNPKTQS